MTSITSRWKAKARSLNANQKIQPPKKYNVQVYEFHMATKRVEFCFLNMAPMAGYQHECTEFLNTIAQRTSSPRD
eukprot:2217459-Amphidinium_carterae.1